MTERLVSCVVAVWNGERYLAEALDSIVAQTYRPLEIIVVDDGSTDGTATVARNHPGPITYLWQPNAGPPPARNVGVRAARGDWVAFLDADDRWHPEKLERQMARFEIRPELDYCVTHIQNFWASELHDEKERFRDHPMMRALPGYVSPTLLARRTLFDSVGLFDERLRHASETAWFLAASERGATGELLPEVLVWRRLHDTNRSHRLASASHEEYLRLVRDALARRRAATGS